MNFGERKHLRMRREKKCHDTKKREREREKVEEVKAENDEKGRETGTRVDSVVSFLASS